MVHLSRQSRLPGLLGRGCGHQWCPAPRGRRRASELRSANLWEPVRCDAGYPGETATHVLAWAQDDALTLDRVVKFHDALKSASHKPEVHIFSAGGHGFGMRKQGTSSDHWIDTFYYWLEAQGFTR